MQGSFARTQYTPDQILRLERGKLITPDEQISLHEIGRGMFSRAYLEDRDDGAEPRVFVTTRDDTMDKELLMEAMSRAGESPHLPAVTTFGYTADRHVYLMPYYEAPLTKKRSTAWQDYLKLRQAQIGAGVGWSRATDYNEAVYRLAAESGVGSGVLNALRAIVDAAADMGGEYKLEFSPRNLAADAGGRLVLLDVAYSASAVLDRRREGVRKRSGRLPNPIADLNDEWLEKLQEDFSVLLKSANRAKSFTEITQVAEAFKKFRHNFSEVFIETFLVQLEQRYAEMGLSKESAMVANLHLSDSAMDWDTSMADIPYSLDRYVVKGGLPMRVRRSEEDVAAKYREEKADWIAACKRSGQVFWSAFKKTTKDFSRSRRNFRGFSVYVPEKYPTEIEGINVVLKGFDYPDVAPATSRDKQYWAAKRGEILQFTRAGLRRFRERAERLAPFLLRSGARIEVSLASSEPGVDGEYKTSDRHIELYPHETMKRKTSPLDLAQTLAHEMGHFYWANVFSEEAKVFWEDTMRGNLGQLDIGELLRRWPDGARVFDMRYHLDDPVMALQVESLLYLDDRDLRQKSDFERLYESGERTLTVPAVPITGYASKNPEEAFCEALGNLIAYGPRTLDPQVVRWLDIAMAGSVRKENPLSTFQAGRRAHNPEMFINPLPKGFPSARGNAGRFLYVHSCPSSTYEDIQNLIENEEQVSMATFRAAIGPVQWRDITAQLGYDKYLPISKDWHVVYGRSVYRGVPCYFLRHSRIEYIFTLGGRLGPSLADSEEAE